MQNNQHSLETFTGQIVDLLNPQQVNFNLYDIAWSLSRTARYNGHTKGEFPYSVAQHSVWVARATQLYFKAEPTIALQALLHDAHEAYIGDITYPLKQTPHMHMISDIEVSLQDSINNALEVPKPNDAQNLIIKRCDIYALAAESKHLMASSGIGWSCRKDVPDNVMNYLWAPMHPRKAYQLFLDAWMLLQANKSLEDLML